MIGRQNTGLIRGEPKHLIERSGIPLPRDAFEIERTPFTRPATMARSLTARSSAFSSCSVEEASGSGSKKRDQI
jgi:hypothetical protein